MDNKPANRSQAFVKSEPGLGDDIPCSKCGAALDTGLECTECEHDMRPEIYPAKATPKAVETEQARDAAAGQWALQCFKNALLHAPRSSADRAELIGLFINEMNAHPLPASGAPAAAPAGKALRWLNEKEVLALLLRPGRDDDSNTIRLTRDVGPYEVTEAAPEAVTLIETVEKMLFAVNGLPTPAGEGER